jgi:hypothetical protein
MRTCVLLGAVTIAAVIALACAVPAIVVMTLLRFPVGGAGGSPAALVVDDIPPVMLGAYRAATKWCPGLPWSIVAAIGKVESDHGRGPELSIAGAEGPLQFLPSTWAAYAVDADDDGVASIWDPADAAATAARLLCANGGGRPGGLAAAIFEYNHDLRYVQTVLAWASRYDRGAPAGTGAVSAPTPGRSGRGLAPSTAIGGESAAT